MYRSHLFQMFSIRSVWGLIYLEVWVLVLEVLWPEKYAIETEPLFISISIVGKTGFVIHCFAESHSFQEPIHDIKWGLAVQLLESHAQKRNETVLPIKAKP